MAEDRKYIGANVVEGLALLTLKGITKGDSVNQQVLGLIEHVNNSDVKGQDETISGLHEQIETLKAALAQSQKDYAGMKEIKDNVLADKLDPIAEKKLDLHERLKTRELDLKEQQIINTKETAQANMASNFVITAIRHDKIDEAKVEKIANNLLDTLEAEIETDPRKLIEKGNKLLEASREEDTVDPEAEVEHEA